MTFKARIELTEKQLDYLCAALFEFKEMFSSVNNEYLYKKLRSKLDEARIKIESEKSFYATKNYQKARAKFENSKKTTRERR